MLPRQADHDKPYVYLTTIESVAALYLCNPLEKPYYWFPYGFESGSQVPIYHEVYPNALRDVSEGISGFLYEIEIDEKHLSPLPSNPCAFVASTPVPVNGFVKIADAYELLLNFIASGKLKVNYFEQKTEKQLEWWYSNLISYLKEKNMVCTPECSYTRFIREKLPNVWSRYITSK